MEVVLAARWHGGENLVSRYWTYVDMSSVTGPMSLSHKQPFDLPCSSLTPYEIHQSKDGLVLRSFLLAIY
jgi:hypothetical protein